MFFCGVGRAVKGGGWRVVVESEVTALLSLLLGAENTKLKCCNSNEQLVWLICL